MKRADRLAILLAPAAIGFMLGDKLAEPEAGTLSFPVPQQMVWNGVALEPPDGARLITWLAGDYIMETREEYSGGTIPGRYYAFGNMGLKVQRKFLGTRSGPFTRSSVVVDHTRFGPLHMSCGTLGSGPNGQAVMIVLEFESREGSLAFLGGERELDRWTAWANSILRNVASETLATSAFEGCTETAVPTPP